MWKGCVPYFAVSQHGAWQSGQAAESMYRHALFLPTIIFFTHSVADLQWQELASDNPEASSSCNRDVLENSAIEKNCHTHTYQVTLSQYNYWYSP